MLIQKQLNLIFGRFELTAYSQLISHALILIITYV